MTTSEKYVTAAYCVVFAVVLVYVLLIAVKLGRLDREVEELEQRVQASGDASEEGEPASVG
jgi:CcmD family protein